MDPDQQDQQDQNQQTPEKKEEAQEVPAKKQEKETKGEKKTMEATGEKKQKEDKVYIKSKKKWKDFQLSEDIIEALASQNKHKPTKVQEEALEIALDRDRKKFNLLIRAINGSGKTLAFLVPMIAALEPGHKFAEDKNFRGKLMKDEIFRPQGVIIIRNQLLQSQLNNYLVNFRDYGIANNVAELTFTVGMLNTEGHKPGDIIVCMPTSFMNRHQRGNMKLDKCKFVAIDQIDDIYNADEQGLRGLLEVVKKAENTNLIACSATMEKKFLEFYSSTDPDFITLNINEKLKEENHGQHITLEGVKNYYKVIKHEDSKAEIYDYIIKTLFKEVFGDSTKMKPQVFMFFNRTEDIANFNNRFEALASDFTTDESKYLEGVTRAAVAAKVYKNGEKVSLSFAEKEDIVTKFRNREINILMCSNIMARGVDIRNAVFVINVGCPENNGNIDVDTYLHRVGRTGRHNDRGIALTLDQKESVDKMVEAVKKIHKIDIHELKSEKALTEEVHKCIEANE